MKFRKYCEFCRNRKMVHLFKNEVPEGKNPILLIPDCKIESECELFQGTPTKFILRLR